MTRHGDACRSFSRSLAAKLGNNDVTRGHKKKVQRSQEKNYSGSVVQKVEHCLSFKETAVSVMHEFYPEILAQTRPKQN